MNPRMLFATVVLGVSVLARMGSAETLGAFAEGAGRPAFFAVSPEVPGAAFASAAAPMYSAGGGGTLQVRRYYKAPPPPPPPPRPAQPRNLFVMRGGFFDSDDASDESWTIGMKTVTNVAPTFRLGGTIDWHRRTNSTRTVYVPVMGGGGSVVQVPTTIYEDESNLVPIMAVAEFVLPAPGIQPYIGVGGGWEFMYVEAFDPATGYGYGAHYDGPGWQIYGGADFLISPAIRLNAEVFHNEATVESNDYDPYYGYGYEQRIDADGTGGRFGLSFAF